MDKIARATALFNPTTSIDEYIAANSNLHIVRSKGFSSLLSLQTCLDEHHRSNPSGRFAKTLTLPLTSSVILANLNANELLLSDVPKQTYFNRLRSFVAAAEPYETSRLGSLSVLDKIRSACLYSAQLTLAARNNTLSLSELSRQPESNVQKRHIPVSQLEKII